MAESRWHRQGGGVTPNQEFFIVHHYDPPTPLDGPRVAVGASAKGTPARSFSLPELQAFGEVTERAVLECAGMSRGYLSEKVPGTQWGHGLVGVADWTGVRLVDLFAAADFDTDFTCAVVSGRDEGTAQPENVHAQFAKGLDRVKAIDPGTLLAWKMNGEPIPHEHGGPLRLVVPGWYGIWWVKWVNKIELTNEPFRGFWQWERYTYQITGPGGEAVREQLPRALITDPVDGASLTGGRLTVTGLAWAMEPVVAVDVTADGGRTWHPAVLQDLDSRWSWRRWRLELELGTPLGLRTISARARDADGQCQEWHSKPNRLGYANNAIHSIAVDLSVLPRE